MKKIRYIYIVVIVAFIFLATGCNGCKKKTRLTPPENCSIDIDNNLIWDEVADARYYTISFYYVDKDTTLIEKATGTSFSLKNLEVGDYEITIQSNGDKKKSKDSYFSGVMYYHKYYENGCVYKLVNNNTEYQVVRVGDANGSFKIEGVYRGKAVTEIANGAFRGSRKITEVEIGENVISIGESAFYNCSKLEKISIPTSVKTLGISCFQLCRNIKEIVLPFSITELSDYLFAYCRSLEKITIEGDIVSIGESCFQDCTMLSKIAIPDSVKDIGEYAFSGCTGLKEVTISKNLEEIPDYCFYKCQGIENIVYPSDSNLKIIGKNAFDGCVLLTEVNIPDGVETIDDFAYTNCSAVEKVTIPNSVTRVGAYAFSGTKFYLDAYENKELFIYADKWLLKGNEYYAETLLEIKPNLIKEDTVGIADYAFNGWASLKTVELNNSIKYIGDYSFYRCLSLWKIKTQNESVVSIGEGSFIGCALTNITLGTGLKEIGNYAFYYNLQLDNNSLYPYNLIPESVTRVGAWAFYKTKLWDTPRENDGIVYAGNWVVGYNSENLTNAMLKFESGRVAGIADYAFDGCESLTTIQGLNNCRYIGVGAFYGCSKIASVSLNRNLEEIRDYTFYQCVNLLQISLPQSLKKIGNSAFYGCISLSGDNTGILDLESSTNCRSIGDYAFALNENLKYVTFGDRLESIGSSAFYKCSNLQEVTFTESIKYIGDRAFYKCENLATVTLNNNLTELPEYAFAYCTNLGSIDIPDSIEKIGKGAFYNCENVQILKLGKNLKTIADYAFSGLSLVEELTLTDSIESIGNFAFKGLKNLKFLIIPESVKIIGQHCLYGCSNLTIYTNASSRLTEWHNRFNSLRRPIFWGVELDENNNVISINVSNSSFENRHASNGINGPSMDGKPFKCWQDENNTTYTNEALSDLDKECRLVVVYNDEN